MLYLGSSCKQAFLQSQIYQSGSVITISATNLSSAHVARYIVSADEFHSLDYFCVEIYSFFAGDHLYLK